MRIILPAICKKGILYSGLTLVQFLSVLFILTQVLFFFNCRVNIVTFIVSGIISFFILVFSVYHEYLIEGEITNAKRNAMYLSLVVFILSMGFIAVSVLFGMSFFDPTHDSNTYHKPYALFFVHGWNPVLTDSPPVIFGIQGVDFMKNTFPKAAELIGSYFYLVSGSLESVKAINLVAMVSAALLAFATFSLFLPSNRVLPGLLSLVAVLNPVWITQSTQFYIDGFFYEIILIVICLMLYYVKSRGDTHILLTIVLGLVLGFSIKGSALLFIPILVAMFLLFLYRYKREKIKPVVPICILTLVVFLVVTGYSPYITAHSKYTSDYSKHVDPLGQNEILEKVDVTNKDVIKAKDELYHKDVVIEEENDFLGNSIKYLNVQLSRWLAPRILFFTSLFSPVSQEYHGMKNPFYIDLSEIPELTGENSFNGYGPFLGLIIVISLISLLMSIIFRNSMGNDAQLLFICILVIFISAILHPGASCSRYVPQFYFIFICISLVGFISKSSLLKGISVVLISILVINILFIGTYWYPAEAEKTRQFDDLLTGIFESAKGPVIIKHSMDATRNDIWDLSYRLTNIVYFQERGIPWSVEIQDIADIQNYTVPLFFETDALVVPKSRQYHMGDTIRPAVMGRYAIDGFSPTFGTHIWTDKGNASLNLVIDSPPEKGYLILRARPFHVKDEYIDQTLWISINNLTLSDPVMLTGLRVNTIIVPLPSGALMNGANIIRFNLPKAKKLPNGAYGMSVRSLSLSDTVPADISEEDTGSGLFDWVWSKK
jgi:4-amino-4-deoxy-L-arabinose transferase-like glycosyltransferase